IELNARQGQITTTGWTISAQSNNGVAGNVFLTAADDIRSGNITSFSKSNTGNPNNFSTIKLDSKSGSVILDGVQLTTTNIGSDFAGDININAAKNIEITDSRGVDNQNNELGIISQGFFGRITIQAGDDVFITNSIVNAIAPKTLPATSLGDDRAGDIDVTSTSSKIEINNSLLTTTTESEFADAGNISLVAPQSVVLRGTNPNTDFRQFISSDLNAPKPEQGLLAEARVSGKNAGGIDITTDELKIENGAAVSVSSPQGQAGDVVILADKIRLNNGAIFASTGQSRNPNEGANIVLLGKNTNQSDTENLGSKISQGQQRGDNLPGSSVDYLLLSNESLIQANAYKSADGGNIAIKTRLLLASPPTGENGSDISANAQGGKGGVLAIDSRPLGAYNIESRPHTTNTPLNDITATSQIGLDGIVSIALPDVDPRRGFLQLPEDLGDSSRLITQSCPVGRTQAASRFIVSGRGGLPPSPSSALSSDALMGITTNASPRETRLMQSSSPSSILVEAKGVNIGPKGEIIFTANPSKPTSDNSWQRNTDCNAQ
ncbi:MAG: hypothetical protein V7L25_03550, partial [Nostoc sp.]|uniref:hypothetical protein n=1 Tax=Nostoc sp. TaxID=1180 RepID=UPI002FF17438